MSVLISIKLHYGEERSQDLTSEAKSELKLLILKTITSYLGGYLGCWRCNFVVLEEVRKEFRAFTDCIS